ncbi:MAG TPA: ATP-dependent endonuclease [Hyphomonas atlantica]|uniref:ATP-dependent endonuclease n=1 Tax=Hyphomonas atlantica TaxID=1280948 RepID=A0A356W9G6_9PROT|nr:ATP-dependent endonuclease [Rhodospirillaceae bacterium]HBQ50329.1 ATP-dependent endonuclease [Hyphomonas atlantica]
MARVRVLEIRNFRGIKALTWYPAPGINCLIGPGDSGKSSILDAIDFCLGARRSIQFTDADFHLLDVETPIAIEVTLGDLDDDLKNLDAYGMYLRGFDADTGTIEDEPEKDAETVLTVKLTVASDLEPTWALVSARAEVQGLTRNLSWGDRVRLAPTRIGAMADYHLGWRRGSVLNRVSEERADASAALAKAARDARAAFGDQAQGQLGETLGIVAATAKELGIAIGEHIKAMLDAHSVSFSGGTISLHDEDGVPLRGLGIGSTRLLIAGLQRRAAAQASIILIDELEHGLEPHRIIRLLGSLGAKETPSPLQVFMTTHSPVALRELSGNQLFVARGAIDKHDVRAVGTADGTQTTIRSHPDAFLAPNVIVCEGASEVGLIRGLDQYRTASGHEAITAQGTALVDSGGGDSDRPFARAAAFHALGYRAAVVRDDDKKPTAAVEAAFTANGGTVIAWRDGRALEDELFLSLTDDGVGKLLDRAVELHGEELVNEHIKSASQNAKDLNGVQTEALIDGITAESRAILGKAARAKKAGWFKSVTWMEDVARDIVGPDLANADAAFRALIDGVFGWAGDAGQ